MRQRVRRTSLIFAALLGYRRKLRAPSLPGFIQAASATALSFAVAVFAPFYVAWGATTRCSYLSIPVETVTPPCQRSRTGVRGQTMGAGARAVKAGAAPPRRWRRARCWSSDPRAQEQR